MKLREILDSENTSFKQRVQLRQAWDIVRLSETIAHAYENTPFYKALWDAHDLSPKQLDWHGDFLRFPLVRKADFAGDPAALVSRVDMPDNIRDTSGTTGLRLPVYTNFDEDRALAELRLGRSRGHPVARLALRILPPPQRLDPAPFHNPKSETRTLVMHVQLRNDPAIWYDAVDMLEGVLLQEYFVGGTTAFVEVIHATPPPLFDYVTRELLARGVRPETYGVKEIVLTGGPLASGVRSFIQDSWGSSVFTTYSCTEVRGELMECPEDPLVFHAGLSLLAEVVEGRTGDPVADGECGEVALTGFVPFQRVMPMVRYCPGDIAQIHQRPCRCGSSQPGLRILGRSSQHLDLTPIVGSSLRFGTTAVLNAVGTTPQIPRFPYPRFNFACEEQADGPPALNIDIESTNPKAFDAASLEAELTRALLADDPVLADAVTRGVLRINLRFLVKNSLTQFVKLYPGR